MRRVSLGGEEGSRKAMPVADSATRARAAGDDVGSVGHCPACGEPSPEPVFDGRKWNFLCRRCDTCTHVDGDKVETVDPLSCPGCRLRDFCQASPSPLARSLSSGAVLRSGLAVMIRPLVHSDLPTFCGLAARARVEAGRGAETDLLARIFCEMSDVDTDRFTWVASTDDGRGLPIAVATFRRCEDDVSCARAALGVDSSYRGQGLGELLYEKLAETAPAYGIESFRAEVSLRRATDANELASLGLNARPLGSDRAELLWGLGHAAPRPAGLARLLVLFERTDSGPLDEPDSVAGAHCP